MKTLNKLDLRLVQVFVMAGFVLFAGCKSTPRAVIPKPGKLELAVKRNAIVQNTDLLVDVIGVDENDEKRLNETSLSLYFGEDKLRDDLLNLRHMGVTFHFPAGASATNPQILRSDDVLWQRWAKHKISHIVVICNLPPLDAAGRRASTSFDWKALKRLPKDRDSKIRRLTFEIFQATIEPPPITK